VGIAGVPAVLHVQVPLLSLTALIVRLATRGDPFKVQVSDHSRIDGS
jgi:hypothetical protein